MCPSSFRSLAGSAATSRISSLWPAPFESRIPVMKSFPCYGQTTITRAELISEEDLAGGQDAPSVVSLCPSPYFPSSYCGEGSLQTLEVRRQLVGLAPSFHPVVPWSSFQCSGWLRAPSLWLHPVVMVILDMLLTHPCAHVFTLLGPMWSGAGSKCPKEHTHDELQVPHAQ